MTECEELAQPQPSKSVTVYATVHFSVSVDGSLSDRDAIQRALSQVDIHEAVNMGQYAEQIGCFMVEQVGDGTSAGATSLYDGELEPVPAGLDPIGSFPRFSRALIRIADGECALVDVRKEATAALRGMAQTQARGGVEEECCVVVSTAHLTHADSTLLGDLREINGLVDVCATRYGFLVQLGASVSEACIPAIEAEMEALGLSGSFRALWKMMRSRGYTWLHLDRDAEVVDGLEIFSW